MVPVLDFDSMAYSYPRFHEDLEIFMNKFLKFNKKSQIQKFKFRFGCNYTSEDQFAEWIGTAVERGIQHLDIEYLSLNIKLQNIYKSNTLVSLKLIDIKIDNPKFIVSLPCLKIMHLEDIRYDTIWLDSFGIVDKLIPGCPVLEDLTLLRYHYREKGIVFERVRSQSIKRFRFESMHIWDGTCFSLEIDTPRLEFLSLKESPSDKIMVKNMSSLLKIDLSSSFNVKHASTLDLSKRENICDFLNNISNVKHMIISTADTLEVLYLYSHLRPIPQFDNLYSLEASFSSTILRFMPAFLENCPNLKNFILNYSIPYEKKETELNYVPKCLLSNVECVEIKELYIEEEIWKKLVTFFLENSLVLKKLILHFKYSIIRKQDSDIFNKLHTFTNRSWGCQIIVHRESWSPSDGRFKVLTQKIAPSAHGTKVHNEPSRVN